MGGNRLAICLVLLLAATIACPADAPRRLDEIVVEERAPGDFEDVERWNREVRDALGRARLKRRGELSAADHAQILILEDEMPVLRRSLDTIERLTREHRFRMTLGERELLELAGAYEKAEAVLENVPDAFMPRCRLKRKHAQRNKAAMCDVDYHAIVRQVDELRRKRRREGVPGEGESIPVSMPRDAPFIRVARSPKPRGARRVHVEADYFRLQQVRVAYAGDVMLERHDFHAIATELPLLRPAHAFRLELPTGTGMSLGNADALKVVGHVSMAGEILRVAQLPRAAGVGHGIVVRGDGTVEGTLVAFAYGWSDRRRMAPVNGLRAAVLPPDARLLTQYDVTSVDAGSPFVRHDLVFVGADAGKVVIELRHYDAPAPEPPARSERFELPARTGPASVGTFELELREIEPQRIKYVVRGAGGGGTPIEIDDPGR
jgi:hypothetical protein